MNKITAYECEFGCGKFLRTRSGMYRHEETCLWNPAKEACVSCGHNESYEEDVGFVLHKGRYCEELGFDIFTEQYNGRKYCPHWVPKEGA